MQEIVSHLAPGWFSVLHLVQEMIQMELTKTIEKPTATIISFEILKRSPKDAKLPSGQYPPLQQFSNLLS